MEQTTAQRLGVDGYVKPEDIAEVANFLIVKHSYGLIPSDVIRAGEEFTEEFVNKYDFPSIMKMKIAACLMEAATIETKLHPDYRVKRTRQG